MNVDKIVSAVENYDAIAEHIQESAEAKDDDRFYDSSSGIVQVFGKLAKQKALKTSNLKHGSTKHKIAEWSHQQLTEFTELELAAPQVSITAPTSLKIVLIRGKYLQEDIKPLMREIVLRANDNPQFLEPIQSDLIKFDDLRVYMSEVIPKCDVKPALVDLSCSVEKTVENDDDLQDTYTGFRDFLPFAQRLAAQKYRAAWQTAWLHILGKNGHPLSVTQIKQILSVMHARIIPNFNKPQLLMDFLVDAYDHGGAVSLLALNALFVLIQHFQLDYPQFFTKLYDLLEDGSLLVSAHRARFLRLLDLFLTSTHLPATIPASIIKRLARLCSFAPPGAIVAILPFVYNQLKRHPTCMVMIHRNESIVGDDPFDFNEKNPLLTHAIDSSLWELQTLTAHYHPNVASIAKIFSQPFKKPNYQLEHFLSHSYETLYATEHNRKRDREPGSEFEEFNVFNESDWVPN